MLGKRKTLASQLIEKIKKNIIDGVLSPGDKLPSEQSLINQYGVSRTVVREAIAGLRADGMVVTRQGIGAFVTENPVSKLELFNPKTLKDILHVLDLRLCLETKAAQLAAEYRTESQLEKIADALDAFKNAEYDYSEVSIADFQFHIAIAEASGNPYFLKLLEHLGPQIIPHSRIDLYQLPDDEADFLDRVYLEHKAMYECIAQRDIEKAGKTMAAHLEKGISRYKKLDSESSC
ncbi:FadR/GntR family transcriptional regulator [Vibrio nigripulchritudo]|uniref:FadR/GntR family transcriptional regulator n=1 Tax=Vibrio nigripulchritudo TaxID=28173 RepID=UPI0024922E1F|nr:FadR/GntR family transcriptional regulator [Vibrio nigripulchritudo]BDU39472.1 GntR family transcriptional regulator [Vibrio nigripulchritudo]